MLYGFIDIDTPGEAVPYSPGAFHSGTCVSRVSLPGLSGCIRTEVTVVANGCAKNVLVV